MSSQPLLKVTGLHKVFHMGGVDVPALRGVNLKVNAGEFVAVLGPSGSGKSTLFHVIGGLTPPSAGTVEIAGEDLSRMSDGERTALRKNMIGFVFQKFNLLPTLTARENIDIAKHIAGNHAPHSDEFNEILALLGIESRLDHKPYALSGGEQQRVAIARAIVNHPRLLLADEPTGNLDSKSADAVLRTLKQLNEKLGQTVLMITHNPEAARFVSQRHIEMRDGLIVRDE